MAVIFSYFPLLALNLGPWPMALVCIIAKACQGVTAAGIMHGHVDRTESAVGVSQCWLYIR
jgi:hypothetical protein